MNSKNNIFEIEKLYSEPGIYIIYNTNKKTAYIGQTIDLKERMCQHLKALYSNISKKKENESLLCEFNKGDNHYLYRHLLKVADELSLDNMESLYFQAAVACFGKKSVHNKEDLTDKYRTSEDELRNAIEQIKTTIMEVLKTPVIRIDEQTKRRINQDIIGKYEEDIIRDVREKQAKNHEGQIEFERISIKDLYENGKFDHIIVGKMGDYVGENNKVQNFTDIIEDKLACIASNKKCLWSAGLKNSVDEINDFIDKYGFGDEKKVYAVFALTSSQYKPKLEKKYIHKESGLSATVPVSEKKRVKKRVKALIIDKFMSVKEDFDLSKFVQNYYYHSKPIIEGQSQRILMNKEIASYNQLSAQIVSKKETIINNDELQKELGINKFDVQEMDKFKKSIPNEKVMFSNANGASYFIIAEVIKADWIYLIEE